VIQYRPTTLAVLGIGAYRSAFGARHAVTGPQPEGIGDTHVWLLPNPSGLNAHYTPATLAAEFGRLRDSLD
jgi:TDG/mug DNA glycosylase family protein